MNKKHYFQVRIENRDDEFDTCLVLNGRWSQHKQEVKKYFNDNFVFVEDDFFNLPKDIKLYSLIEAEYTPSSYNGRWVDHKVRVAIKKSDFETLKFTEIDKKYYPLIKEFKMNYMTTCQPFMEFNNGHQTYISEENKKIIMEAIATEQKPLVIKGTNYPFWFKVNDVLIPSETPNWFINLYTRYKILDEVFLEEYKDKPNE